MGPVRPLADPRTKIEGVDDRDLVEVLSTGLGVARETVNDLITPGISRRPVMAVTIAEQIADADRLADVAERELGPLLGAATEMAASLAAGALRFDLPAPPAPPRGSAPPESPGGSIPPDALDRLLGRDSGAEPGRGVG
jgi:hypothetical protein